MILELLMIPPLAALYAFSYWFRNIGHGLFLATNWGRGGILFARYRSVGGSCCGVEEDGEGGWAAGEYGEEEERMNQIVWQQQDQHLFLHERSDASCQDYSIEIATGTTTCRET